VSCSISSNRSVSPWEVDAPTLAAADVTDRWCGDPAVWSPTVLVGRRDDLVGDERAAQLDTIADSDSDRCDELCGRVHLAQGRQVEVVVEAYLWPQHGVVGDVAGWEGGDVAGWEERRRRR